jgi:2-C-methyl-D-erythritol 4-phosphate cytidylyltransferase / 2-C-methyl-D-erythritol 2,4-cyclodiphosphate synthase
VDPSLRWDDELWVVANHPHGNIRKAFFMKTVALVVAAGSGARMGGVPKQYRPLGGVSVLEQTVKAFRDHRQISDVVVVMSPEHSDLYDALNLQPGVPGGATRQESVRLGLEAIGAADYVLIHDAARPFVSNSVIDYVLAALANHQGAAPALAVVDSLRRRDFADVPRDNLFRVQTPQGFRFADILAAHRAALPGHTDDISVARAAGLSLAFTAGSDDNFKITSDADWSRAQAMITHSLIPHVGNGFDVHRFGANADGSRDHIWLCGVKVPHSDGVIGHSDADVGLHALTDAIFGALGDGDIGSHFPPSDATWRGAASWQFLGAANNCVQKRGGTIAHVDVTIMCERPKVGPHREAMRARIADILTVPLSRVSVKATTTEELGFTGRSEGIAAQANATVLLPWEA